MPCKHAVGVCISCKNSCPYWIMQAHLDIVITWKLMDYVHEESLHRKMRQERASTKPESISLYRSQRLPSDNILVYLKLACRRWGKVDKICPNYCRWKGTIIDRLFDGSADFTHPPAYCSTGHSRGPCLELLIASSGTDWSCSSHHQDQTLELLIASKLGSDRHGFLPLQLFMFECTAGTCQE